jgi:tRNA(fMet)-specific endonuclease VapC
MRICIDTSAYSTFMQGDRSIKELLESADQVLVPSIVAGELYAGFYMGQRAKTNIEELNSFLERPGIVTVSIDLSTAERYGLLVQALKEAGTPIPTNDIWIAAVALETGARLLTRDRHFKSIPGLLSHWGD